MGLRGGRKRQGTTATAGTNRPKHYAYFDRCTSDAPPVNESKGGATYAVLRPIELSIGYETGKGTGSLPESENINELLTNQLRFGTIGAMRLRKTSLWPALREQILKLVRQRGMKSVLARDIGVSRQEINALLSRKGTRGPSAEYALRLSKWVEIAEAQQKQSAGVSEAPARKIRRKSKHEKPTDRKKK